MHQFSPNQSALHLAITSLLIACNPPVAEAFPPGVTVLPPVPTKHYRPLTNQIEQHQPIRSTLIECPTPIFDFGRLKGGQSVYCTFPIKNVSDELVYIKAKPGCICTTAGIKSIVLPGQTVYLNLNLATKRGNGRVTKPVTVYAHAIRVPSWFANAMRLFIDWRESLPRNQQMVVAMIGGISYIHITS